MMPHSSRTIDRYGFSLIEAVTTLAIIAILSVGLVSIASSALRITQEQTTSNSLTKLREGVQGTPVVVSQDARTLFGYVGDMGNVPLVIEDLWDRGSQPAFAFDQVTMVGAGWNGPYLETDVVEYIDALGLDAWGNDFFYDTTPYVDPTLGLTVLGKLASLGPDRALDSEDDLTVLFLEPQIVSQVQGFVLDPLGQFLAGVDVVANFPANGTLTTASTTTDPFGFYSIDDVPYGNRSLTPEATLVVSPGTAQTTSGSGDDVEVYIQNLSANDVSFDELTVEWFVAPPAYLTRLRLDNTNIYNDNNPRLASGTLLSFATWTLEGSGVTIPPTTIQVQSATTNVPSITIDSVGLGETVRIRMNNFRDNQNGGGSTVDMTGVPFQLTFSNGSVLTFTPQ